MLLFFDTETTSANPHEAHIVQLGAALVDWNNKIASYLSLVVQPEGWQVPEDAYKVHGISTEYALEVGIPLEQVLRIFNQMALMLKGSGGGLLIAHNINYDIEVLTTNIVAHTAYAHWDDVPRYCTMRESTNILKLPGKYGNFKWPKLSEAYRHFTGHELEGAHDALTDTKACIAVYFGLTGGKHWPEGYAPAGGAADNPFARA